MTYEQKLKNLSMPKTCVDVVLDTDAFNEIDDQYAIAYMLLSCEKLNPKAVYAAPFLNEKVSSVREGMEKSYDEILKILDLIGDKTTEVYRGSTEYLPNGETFAESPAARDLAERAMNYSAENPLYVASIGAITNIASAILMNPEIAERIVVVWLGGHAHHHSGLIDPQKTWAEFNMCQDIPAVRVVMQSGAPFVQLPCMGIVSELRISKPELEYWLMGKNPLCTYLAENTIAEAESYAKGTPWTRVIWDIAPLAWILGGDGELMHSAIVNMRLPNDDGTYSAEELPEKMTYVAGIERDRLMTDLITKLNKGELL